MFQQTAPDQFKSVKRIDQSLAECFVICKGADAQLAARNGQVEWNATIGSEGDVNFCGKRWD